MKNGQSDISTKSLKCSTCVRHALNTLTSVKQTVWHRDMFSSSFVGHVKDTARTHFRTWTSLVLTISSLYWLFGLLFLVVCECYIQGGKESKYCETCVLSLVKIRHFLMFLSYPYAKL